MAKWRISLAVVFGAAILGTVAVGEPVSAQDAKLACTNAGNQYLVGEFACIAACHGQRRLARCDKAEAKASWTYVQESCPTATINPPWPSVWTEIPAVTAMSPIPLNVNRSAPLPEMRLTFAAFSVASTVTQ